MSEDVPTNAPGSIDELKVGMALKGTVKRLELYGAFVDIGMGQDGLLHISQLGEARVRNVEDVVKVGDEVTAYVIKIDRDAGRVALSLVQPPAMTWDQVEEGQMVTGTVVRIERFGAFVDIGAERPGMVHVSEMTDGYVQNPSDIVNVGQEVEVRILKINRKKRQIDLSMKEDQQQAVSAMAEDEEEEEVPTAMALAFRRAMESQDEDEELARRNNKRKGASDEQDEIIARTLRNHSTSN
jgi:small subunit ribosomal protein S1